MNVNETWEKVENLMIQAKNNEDFLRLIKEYNPKLIDYVKDFDLSKTPKDSYDNLCFDYQFGKIFKRRIKGETLC